MSQKVRNSIINGFFAAELGWLILSQMVTSYTSIYLTDIVLISAASVGTIMLVSNLIGAFGSPVIGGIIENFSFRWGKYRSWLLIASVATAIIYIFFFTHFAMSSGASLAFYGTLYLLTTIGTLLYVSSQNALIAVIGRENDDRIKLSARRVQMISIASIVGGLIIMPMILFVGGGDQARGFSITAVIFAIIMVLGYLLMAWYAKPFVDSIPKEAQKVVTLKKMAGRYLLTAICSSSSWQKSPECPPDFPFLAWPFTISNMSPKIC
jgi:Na+/melibiose symporter-like transporter